MKSLLVTGCAGFIGYHAASRWLAEGGTVIGCDNMNDYYDPSLKQSRLKLLQERKGFTFVQAALEDGKAMNDIFERHRPRQYCILVLSPVSEIVWQTPVHM